VGGTWTYRPVIPGVIGMGIWLVLVESDEWAFSQVWIWLALVLAAVSTALGIYSGAEGGRVSRTWPTRAGPRMVWLGVA
jgi:hypothetical protein